MTCNVLLSSLDAPISAKIFEAQTFRTKVGVLHAHRFCGALHSGWMDAHTASVGDIRSPSSRKNYTGCHYTGHEECGAPPRAVWGNHKTLPMNFI